MNSSTTSPTRRASRFGSAAAAALILVTALPGVALAKNGDDDGPGDDRTSAPAASPSPSSSSDDSRRGGDDSPSPDDSPSASDSASGGSSSSGASSVTTRTDSKGRVRRTARGNCTASTDWKLKGKTRDGRIEVEFEVDSNRAGQRWTYTIRNQGDVVASGRRVTRGPSGSFSVERKVANRGGLAAISATARNAATGETCRASL